MSRRPVLSAEFLQWFGLLAGALVWAAQHVIGVGTTIARCSTAGPTFAIHLDTWQVTTTVVAATLALSAEAASVVVVLRTRRVTHDGPPPDGRRHFFALGALVANLLFLAVILLGSLSTLAFDPCRQG